MRFSHCFSLLGLVAVAAFAPKSAAQVSKVLSPIYDIQSLADQVSPEKREAELQKLAVSIREECADIYDAIGAVGEELAEAEGPYEDEREAFRAKVEEVVHEVHKMDEEASALFDKVSSDNCTDLKLQAKYLASVWAGFSKCIDDMRKFLNQGLKTANELRTNAGAAAELRVKLQQEAEKKEREGSEKHKALFFKWFDCTVKASEANTKQQEAYQRWFDFVKGGGDRFSDKGLELIIKWDDLVDEHREAKIQAGDAFIALEEAVEEMREISEESAEAFANLEQFVQDMVDNKADEIWSHFDGWLKTFEKDIGG